MKAASGTFVLRISPDLHRRLRTAARRRKLSLNRLCAEVLERSLCSREPHLVAGAAGEGADLLGSIIQRSRDVFGDALIGLVVFGSTARGEDCAESDVDLLLVVAEGEPLRRALYVRWAESVEALAEAQLGREVNPHFCHLPATPDDAGGLWFEVAIDGVVLWDRNGEVSRCLRDIRRYIASGAVTRRVRHGHPYWVRGGNRSAA